MLVHLVGTLALQRGVTGSIFATNLTLSPTAQPGQALHTTDEPEDENSNSQDELYGQLPQPRDIRRLASIPTAGSCILRGSIRMHLF